MRTALRALSAGLRPTRQFGVRPLAQATPFTAAQRWRSSSSASSAAVQRDAMTGEIISLPDIDPSLLKIQETTNAKTPLPSSKLVFGKTFTDHMLMIPWTSEAGWAEPVIKEFEGMKAYRCEDGTIRLFRPDMNMARMNRSAARIALPQFNGDALIELIKKMVMLDSKWIPGEPGYSLYLRPTMIATQNSLGVGPSSSALLFVIASPVGPYYATGFKPVSLQATTKYVRAAPGGTGGFKLGANYSPGVVPQVEAAKQGYAQNLWLHGPEHYLTEVGTMNLFVVIENEQGQTELLTPPLEDLILPGVTRDSVLSIARDHVSGKTQVPGLPESHFVVSERKMTMPQLAQLAKEGKVKEVFGAGTAAIVTSVDNIGYEGTDIPIPAGQEGLGPIAKAMLDRIQGIQTGKIEHEWSVVAGKA
ncbi:hypothetical protein QFC22_004565 [Naganishia vaughanmartiniae]|uniref:Uncharacterized protein n=1 Tax=Naganishia vaughanmartiniae TaxID=1424756 RepID=A0ACC2WZG8_9TREE|nr:hypothetical protein QFC22_004565 [Naganishia vaughanmartiniae]